MAGMQDFEIFSDDFNGAVATFPTSADPATAWLVDDVSTTGTPVYTKGTSEATLTLNNDSDVVVVYNVRQTFGVAAIDWRGLFRNSA